MVDDTGFPKDGSCSVGVQRQYSGTLGKTANCQLGVSVNAVCEQASCPLNWRLFLPESWDDAAMATRRAACHLPAAVHHRPKWRLVLDMLDELAGWELSPPVLLQSLVEWSDNHTVDEVVAAQGIDHGLACDPVRRGSVAA